MRRSRGERPGCASVRSVRPRSPATAAPRRAPSKPARRHEDDAGLRAELPDAQRERRGEARGELRPARCDGGRGDDDRVDAAELAVERDRDGRPTARSKSARPPRSEPVKPTRLMAGCSHEGDARPRVPRRARACRPGRRRGLERRHDDRRREARQLRVARVRLHDDRAARPPAPMPCRRRRPRTRTGSSTPRTRRPARAGEQAPQVGVRRGGGGVGVVEVDLEVGPSATTAAKSRSCRGRAGELAGEARRCRGGSPRRRAATSSAACASSASATASSHRCPVGAAVDWRPATAAASASGPRSARGRRSIVVIMIPSGCGSGSREGRSVGEAVRPSRAGPPSASTPRRRGGRGRERRSRSPRPRRPRPSGARRRGRGRAARRARGAGAGRAAARASRRGAAIARNGGDAADPDDVRLQDVGGARVEEVTEAVDRVAVLAQRDRDLGRGAELGVPRGCRRRAAAPRSRPGRTPRALRGTQVAWSRSQRWFASIMRRRSGPSRSRTASRARRRRRGSGLPTLILTAS